jgi:hypothetical protein
VVSIRTRQRELFVPRQFISEQRLLSKINSELAAHEECQDYTIAALMGVENLTGCNWAVAAISGPVSFAEVGATPADKIIDSFKALYNCNGLTQQIDSNPFMQSEAI